jgi:hypothetical protein
MQQQGTIALFQYWNRLRDGRPAPQRAEVEPADIKNLLADTFILEADSRGEAVFRLAGTRLCAVYGRELKGFSFPSIWRAKDHRVVTRLLGGIFSDRSVAVLQYRGFNRSERSVGFEMLLLPLDAGRENPRCLGLVTACERAFWLGADAVVDAEVTSIRVLDPDREPTFLANRPPVPVGIFGSMANDTPLAIRSGPARRVRHLLVLDGGLQK